MKSDIVQLKYCKLSNPIALTTPLCKAKFVDQNRKMATSELATSVTGQTPFVIDLLKIIYKNGENLVVSPYSLVSALAMLLPGTDGNSRFELLRAIFDQSAKDGSNADRHVQLFAQLNKANLEKNAQTLHVANMLYSHLK